MTVNVQYGGINSQHNQIATCNTNSTEAATAVFNREVGTPANTPGKNKLNKIFENLTNFISSAKNHIKDIGINRSLYSLNIKDSTVTNKNSSAMTMKVVNKKAAAIQAESNAVNNNPNEKNISNGVSAYRNHTEYKDLKGKEYKFLLFQEGLNRLVKGEKLLPNQNEIFKEAFNIAKPCMDIEFCTIIENKLAELNVEGEEKNIAEQKLATDSQSLTPIQSQSTHPNLPPPPPPLQLQTLDKQIPDVSQLLPSNKEEFNKLQIKNGANAYRSDMKESNAKDQDSNVILFTQGLEKAFQGKQLTDRQRKIFPDAFKIAKPHMDSEFCKVIEDHLTAVLKINPMAHELSPNGWTQY